MPLDMMGVGTLGQNLRCGRMLSRRRKQQEATIENKEESLVEDTAEENEEILSADELDEMITFE